LLSLVRFLPFSFSKEKEKEMNEKLHGLNFTQNIRLVEILIFKLPDKSKFEAYVRT